MNRLNTVRLNMTEKIDSYKVANTLIRSMEKLWTLRKKTRNDLYPKAT